MIIECIKKNDLTRYIDNILYKAPKIIQIYKTMLIFIQNMSVTEIDTEDYIPKEEKYVSKDKVIELIEHIIATEQVYNSTCLYTLLKQINQLQHY